MNGGCPGTESGPKPYSSRAARRRGARRARSTSSGTPGRTRTCGVAALRALLRKGAVSARSSPLRGPSLMRSQVLHPDSKARCERACPERRAWHPGQDSNLRSGGPSGLAPQGRRVCSLVAPTGPLAHAVAGSSSGLEGEMRACVPGRKKVAPRAGLEPATAGLEIRSSIQLSYRGARRTSLGGV